MVLLRGVVGSGRNDGRHRRELRPCNHSGRAGSRAVSRSAAGNSGTCRLRGLDERGFPASRGHEAVLKRSASSGKGVTRAGATCAPVGLVLARQIDHTIGEPKRDRIGQCNGLMDRGCDTRRAASSDLTGTTHRIWRNSGTRSFGGMRPASPRDLSSRWLGPS